MSFLSRYVPWLVRVAVLLLGATLGCSSSEPVPVSGPDAIGARPDPDKTIRDLYPQLDSLYSGQAGIYRGCGPTNGVCHNNREFPNFASMGSILETIGRPCNLNQTEPAKVHDLCETRGDYLVFGDRKFEIGWIEPLDGLKLTASKWRVHLRDPLGDTALEKGTVYRGDSKIATLSTKLKVAHDKSDARSILMTFPDGPSDGVLLLAFRNSDFLGLTSAVVQGDRNHNDVYGADLGGRLIKPGDPSRSYVMVRLTDPEAGPLMPRANCCHWSKASLRALYCWISGLKEDGSNATDPIDYAGCSEGPSENIAYPEPGPLCEASGLCPTSPRLEVTDEPTWTNLYHGVIKTSCAGKGCHSTGAGGFSVTDEAQAFSAVLERIVPGKPDESRLFQRMDPMVCKAPDCSTMPLGGAPLSPRIRELFRAWIKAGAIR